MSSQKLDLAKLIKVVGAKQCLNVRPVSVVLIKAQPCHLTNDAFSSREATTQIGLDFPFSFFPLKLLPRSVDATVEGSEGLASASEQRAAAAAAASGLRSGMRAKAKGEPLGVTRHGTESAKSDQASEEVHLQLATWQCLTEVEVG